MIRFVNRIAGGLVCLIGFAHLAVGHTAFARPTEARIWFASAGFLLVTTGLANLAAGTGGTRLQSGAAASGSLAILIIGAMFARSNPDMLRQPQTIILLVLGALLTGLRIREMFAARPAASGGAA